MQRNLSKTELYLSCEQHLSRFFFLLRQYQLIPGIWQGSNLWGFTESADLWPDEYVITFWKNPQNSCLGPKRMVFACPRARAYGVVNEVELYSLCQRGVSEVM